MIRFKSILFEIEIANPPVSYTIVSVTENIDSLNVNCDVADSLEDLQSYIEYTDSYAGKEYAKIIHNGEYPGPNHPLHYFKSFEVGPFYHLHHYPSDEPGNFIFSKLVPCNKAKRVAREAYREFYM